MILYPPVPDMINYFGKLYKRFVAWMKYNPPCALSMSGWNSFKDEFKTRAPVRYWIIKTLPKWLYPIRYRFIVIKDWLRYRTINRYHVVDTGLKPDYYEIDSLLLHSSFNILKDFVEKEQAWSTNCWSSTEPLTRTEKLPLYYELFYRKPELGVKHLEWASTLDDPSIPVHQQSPDQAKTARETLLLYKWWTEIRPARHTNYPTYDDQGFTYGPLDDNFDKTAEDYVAYEAWYRDQTRREEEWENEDTEMLCRLMRIRKSLWT